MPNEHRVIATCGIVAVGVGSANAVLKEKRLPSSRFLIGSGVAFLLLSALAEGEPELAKGLAIGVVTTVLLGDGGGVLSYIDRGEIDTKKPKPDRAQRLASAPPLTPTPQLRVVPNPNGQFRPDTIPGFPGLTRNPPAPAGT